MSNHASSPRACITGIGAVSPLASNWRDISAAAQERTVFAPWSPDLKPPFEGARLGIVKEFPKERYFAERQLRLMDKAMSLSTVSAGFALEDAGLMSDGNGVVDGDNIATVLGSAQGEAASLFRFGSPLFQTKVGGVNPAHFPMIARNVACGQLAIRFGLRGWSTMIASGDAAGAHALARAAELIASGRTHTVLVGAYEVLSQMGLHQWKIRRAKHAEGGAPLDPESNEWVPVEGASFFVVESADHAQQRNRTPYAYIDACSHGFSRGAGGQGWPALVDRFLSKCPPNSRPVTQVSSVSASDGAQQHRDASAAFNETLARLCPAKRQLNTRPLFGDARSMNPMLSMAMAAESLSATGKPGDSALVSSLNERGGYALISLSAA